VDLRRRAAAFAALVAEIAAGAMVHCQYVIGGFVALNQSVVNIQES
jgi:hypothetical protein